MDLVVLQRRYANAEKRLDRMRERLLEEDGKLLPHAEGKNQKQRDALYNGSTAYLLARCDYVNALLRCDAAWNNLQKALMREWREAGTRA